MSQKIDVDGDDKLTEIRNGLSQVRFDGTPPQGVKALFTACFQLLDIVEFQRVELAGLRARLIKHEIRLREGDVKQSSFVEKSEQGVLDVFR